jgi:putative tricarboxylic transport membrane protein
MTPLIESTATAATATVPRASVRERLARARASGALPEFGVSGFLLLLGAVVLFETTKIPTDFVQRGPVGPRAIPTGVGVLLLVVGAFHALNVARGGRGEADASEDVELDGRTDWRTLALMAAAFVANVALIEQIGWPLSGALLFWVTARALGSRTTLRDLGLALALSIGSYVLFANGLGIPLPAGPLGGML